MRMEVLAINGSPKGEKSNTMLILQPFLEGLEGDGASTELVQVRDLEVRTCDGDYFCWAKKPGVFRYHDDMEDLLPRISAADLLVLATPLYLSLIHISEPTRLRRISYAVFCLKKK